jgi:uncharacterized protein involved in exopolysaccharide biosynthesis
MVEDEIDMRYYVQLLIRHWKWITAAVLVAGVVVFGLGTIRQNVYEATAAAAVVRSRTAISLDERIETLEDYQLGGGRLIEDRMTALLALADSNEVMQAILADAGDRLAPEQRSVRALRNMISVELAGDLIAFKVRHADPEAAALVANSATEAYVEHANRVYGASEVNVENIATQVELAREHYDAAQLDLQNYLADERLSTLSLTLERELSIKRALMDSYLQSRVAIETSDATSSSELLTDMYTELKQIEIWLADAETLREQVGTNSGSFASRLGDTLALLMLRSQVYSGDSALELQMDLANTEIDDVRAADVDNLITALQTRRAATQERIEALTATLGSSETGIAPFEEQPLRTRIDALTNEIVELESQLETELATRDAGRRELEAARDRAWETYQALTNQLVEAQIKAQSSNSEVRVADVALVPETPMGSRMVTNTLLAVAVAVMLAVGVILFLDWWAVGERASRQPEENAPPAWSGAPVMDEPVAGQTQPRGQPGD